MNFGAWRDRREVVEAHEATELDSIAKGLGRVATAPEDATPITWGMRQIVLTRLTVLMGRKLAHMASFRPIDARDLTMRVLVCPDSFKGTFSAVEVAAALGAGIEEAGGVADLCPAADGGEGTAETVRAAIGGEVRTAAAHDPLGRPIEARFALVEDGATAVIDTAAASGLPLVAPAERDAEAASTYGTGELIAAAVEAGARRVLLAAGGSATTDGGTGAIEALRERGFEARDR